MKFKEIQFEDVSTQRVYNNYIKDIRTAIKAIPESDREEVLMEFNSHIYEHLQQNSNQPKLEALLNIIEKLGAPQDVLKPLVADKLLDKATRTFNPLHVFKALLFNLTNGVSYFIFFILYLFLGTFIFLIFAKIFNPNVGMFFKNGEFTALGMVYDRTGYEEVLGHWFIPVMIVATIVIYLLLTLLLKFKKSLSKLKQK